MRTQFTHREAQAKIGKRVRTLVDLAEVPRGTLGTVTADAAIVSCNTDFESGYEFDVVIEWDPSPAGRHPITPLQDWFNKSDYERYLEEVGESDPVDVFVREALLNAQALKQPYSFFEEDDDDDQNNG